MTIQRIGVVGAGTMGNGIAQVFMQAGFDVRLIDAAPTALERARGSIEKSLGKFVEKGKLTGPARDEALARLSPATSIDVLADADYVVEAIFEDLEAKRGLFARLDQITRPHVILSSNTSSISITLLGAATTRPDKVLGMHFMNPVPLMTLVELIRGQATSPESMLAATELCMRLNKTAVEAADYPGFIANRILMPMINEAVFALMEGVGTADSIDTVMKLGMNHPMGPLTLADFIGLDVCLAIMEVLHRRPGGSQVQAVPAAPPDGRGRATGTQERPGVLPVLAIPPAGPDAQLEHEPGNRCEDEHLAGDRLQVERPESRPIVAQNPEEQVDPREVVLAAHRPERHHAERRGRIGPKPIEKDVTRVGARRGRSEAALPRERADGKPGDQRGPQRMRGSLVLVEEQVNVGNQGDGREQRRRTKRARHRPVARRGDDPSSGDSPQRMSERRRHPNDPTGSDRVRPGSDTGQTRV